MRAADGTVVSRTQLNSGKTANEPGKKEKERIEWNRKGRNMEGKGKGDVELFRVMREEMKSQTEQR